MKDFDYDEDNMMGDVIGESFMYGDSVNPMLKNANISMIKPLSKIVQHQYYPNQLDLEAKVSNLLDQGDMPNKKFSYIMESKSATQEKNKAMLEELGQINKRNMKAAEKDK